jgi:hypothetical protein
VQGGTNHPSACRAADGRAAGWLVPFMHRRPGLQPLRLILRNQPAHPGVPSHDFIGPGEHPPERRVRVRHERGVVDFNPTQGALQSHRQLAGLDGRCCTISRPDADAEDGDCDGESRRTCESERADTSGHPVPLRVMLNAETISTRRDRSVNRPWRLRKSGRSPTAKPQLRIIVKPRPGSALDLLACL